jgi:capsular exopolysaccharide synthesis family protein
MLSVGRMFGAAAPARQRSRSGAAWDALDYPAFEETVRRIYTRCGWTSATSATNQVLALCSAVHGEGKTFLAEALAISAASDHVADVILIECDLYHPCLAADFGLSAATGLGDVLSGRAEFADCLHRGHLPNLWLLPAGSGDENPSRLLRSPAMTAVLEEVRRRFSFVVLDLPGVLSSSDASVLAQQSDGVLLVVRAGRTDQRAVDQVLQQLAGATIHGVVLNRWQSQVPDLVRRLIET